MGMNKCASRLSAKTFTAGDLTLTVASGEPVTVYGITLRAVTANVFTIQNGTSGALFTYSVAVNSSDTIFICWKADAGIEILSAQNDGSAAVFHDSPGN